MNAQERVYACVEMRGYLDPAKWTKDQLIVRQIVKLIEELGEAAQLVEVTPSQRPLLSFTNGVLERMQKVGREAKRSFDEQLFDGPNILPDSLRAEITDIQVVLFTVAELLGFDVVEAAQEKAAADVARGLKR